MAEMERARSTTLQYLVEFIRAEKPATISAWVGDDTYQRVAAAARQVGLERLAPIFEALGQAIPYDAIRLVVSHLKFGGSAADGS
jgi:ATP-dependent DNA helicase RecQ